MNTEIVWTCKDCGNFSRITKKCSKGHTMVFNRGCKQCGNPVPFPDRKCKDHFDSPDLDWEH